MVITRKDLKPKKKEPDKKESGPVKEKTAQNDGTNCYCYSPDRCGMHDGMWP